MGILRTYWLAAQINAPFAWGQKPRQQIKQRGLATPGGSDDGEKLSRLHVNGQAVKYWTGTVGKMHFLDSQFVASNMLHM
jgi:hypothetical protein